MSTAFDGQYCLVKDKMMMSEAEAIRFVRTRKGCDKYLCPVCKTWHVTSVRGDNMRKTQRRRWRKH